MPEQSAMPRKAEIVPVIYKDGAGHEVRRYELRGIDPEKGILLSEHEREEDAREALYKYEEGEEW